MTFIGGFFAIELPPPGVPALGEFWRMPADPALTYVNGRSALAALLAGAKPATLWLPAYVCPSVLEAAAATATAVSYFPVDETLQPDVAWLDSAVRTGDMILAVDYFGKAPGPEFLDFVRRRPDLCWVEDACHAVDTGIAPWGRWCLRSPRKLVGVADGGFIVPAEGITPAQRSVPQPGLDIQRAAQLRFEDEDERINGQWHEANRSREDSEAVSLRRMTRLSRELLARLPMAPVADRRRDNFRVLARLLGHFAFLADSNPAFVPLGFPIRLRTGRDRVRGALIASGIFPAVHWADLPAPAAFTTAHGLAAQLLTLPCDQRYQPPQMEHLAEVLMRIVPR